jgi:hypothetical protein
LPDVVVPRPTRVRLGRSCGRWGVGHARRLLRLHRSSPNPSLSATGWGELFSPGTAATSRNFAPAPRSANRLVQMDQLKNASPSSEHSEGSAFTPYELSGSPDRRPRRHRGDPAAGVKRWLTFAAQKKFPLASTLC